MTRDALTQALIALQAVTRADFSHLSHAEQQRLTDYVTQVCETLHHARQKGDQHHDRV